MAYVGPVPVSQRLLAQLAGSPEKLDLARRELLRFSLVQPINDGVVMHPLVGLVMCARLLEEDDWSGAWAAVQILLETMPRHFDSPEAWAAGAEVLPHALAAAGHVEDHVGFAREAMELLHRCASYLTALSDLRAAADAFGREQTVLLSIPDLHPLTEASFLNDYGVVLRDLGRLGEARRILARAHKLKERHGASPELIASSADNLGQVEQRLNNFNTAHELFAKALDACRSAFGPDDLRCALRLSNIGTLRLDESEPGKARDDFEAALRIIERMPEDAPERKWHEARVRGNLGNSLLDLGDARGALDQQEAALEIKQGLVTEPHATLADTIGNLGNALLALDKPKAAIARQEEALAMTEALYGPTSPGAARTLWNLGNAFEAAGDDQRATDTHVRAADMAQDLGLVWPPSGRGVAQ